MTWISPGSAVLCQRIILKSVCKDTRYDTGASGMQPAININYNWIQRPMIRGAHEPAYEYIPALYPKVGGWAEGKNNKSTILRVSAAVLLGHQQSWKKREILTNSFFVG